MQKMSEKPLTKCPDCGGALKKKMSSTSFVLKGTGWYATDYASDKNKQQKPAGDKKKIDSRFETTGSDEKKKEAKSEGQSDTKSESRDESKGDTRSESGTESKSDTKSDTKADTGKKTASS